MPQKENLAAPRESHNAPDASKKNSARKPAKNEPGVAGDIDQKIDRPGFDLGGSSGDTQAGTGLGLGNDASETPGGRRLPGRGLDDDLIIPHWRGPKPDGTIEPAKKPSDRATKSSPMTKSKS